MKNFNQKVKFDERQELFEKQGHSPSAKQIKPQFLSNDSLLASLPQGNFPASPYRPKSTLTNWNTKFSTQKERQPSEISPSAHRNSLQEDLGIHRKSVQKATKKTMRRRSCCCEWCGGISSLEVKHKDVLEEVVSTQLKIDLGVSNNEPTVEVQSTEEKGTPSTQDKQDVSPKAGVDQSRLSPYKLLTINTVDPTPLSVELGTSQTPNSVLIASPQAKPSDQVLLEGYKVAKQRKKTEPRLQEDILRQSSSSALMLTRQGSFSPIRLRRDNGMSSIHLKKAENKKADSVTIDLPTINGPTTLNTTTSPKWIASPANVMQKLARDVSGFFPGSPQKMAKLTSPLAAPLTEKIRMMQNMKLESLKVSEGKEQEIGVKGGRITTEPDRKRPESSIANLVTEEGLGEDIIVMKSTGHQFKSKNRLGSVGLKKENSLRTIRSKIASIYIEEKSSSPSIYNKTMTKMKTSTTPLKRVVSETQTLLFKSDYKGEASSKELVAKEEGKGDGKSPRVKKLKKRKNTVIDITSKAKEEHVKLLMQTFVPSKKNSMSVFPNIPQSLQNKIVKRREESRKLDDIQQIVATYAE